MNCCRTPFHQHQTKQGHLLCLSCKSKIKKITEYICPFCNCEQGSMLSYLDMEKDDRADWVVCNHCQKNILKINGLLKMAII